MMKSCRLKIYGFCHRKLLYMQTLILEDFSSFYVIEIILIFASDEP